MSDLRAAPRRHTFLGARIEFDSRTSTMDCVVRDVSETGARLALASPVVLPETFSLIIEPQNKRYRARVKWQRLTVVGVQFA